MAYLKMYGGRIQIGKTIDIYSAAVDTIYYMKNGVAVTVGTTDATGKVTVNKSALPNGTYTLYSSVAKDPSNLSNAYSKSVTVTSNTKEIYLMPDGEVLYWWGYKNNLENVNESNGWVISAETYTEKSPVYNTNYVDCISNQSRHYSGIGSINAVLNVKKIYSVYTGLNYDGYNYGGIRLMSTKAIYGTGLISSNYPSNTIALREKVLDEPTTLYIATVALNSAGNRIHALYVETQT